MYLGPWIMHNERPAVMHTQCTKYIIGMVQAWVAQKLVNVTFYEFFDVRLDTYLKRLLVKTHNSKRVFK